MKYTNIKYGKFIERPNRFIAYVEIDGKIEVCHVKNTGRCKELLVKDSKVIIQYCNSETRKTNYDLIAVYKGNKLINMDSQAPNKVFSQWAEDYFKPDLLKAESKYGNSRFDFYMEKGSQKIYIEVKGVTLEQDGVVSFPDAPTERGVKHIYELCKCIDEGYDAYIFFIVQMENVKFFKPNRINHPEFADALLYASEKGVKIKCLDCKVSEDELVCNNFIDVNLC